MQEKGKYDFPQNPKYPISHGSLLICAWRVLKTMHQNLYHLGKIMGLAP